MKKALAIVLLLIIVLSTSIFAWRKFRTHKERKEFYSTEVSDLIPGKLTIIFDDNLPLEDAQRFLDQNNLRVDQGFGYSLYEFPPTINFTINGLHSLKQCRQEIDQLQAQNQNSQLRFNVGSGGGLSLNLHFKRHDHEPIKNLFKNFPCLAGQSWQFVDRTVNILQDETWVSAHYNPPSFDRNKIEQLLKTLESKNQIEKCVFNYDYMNGECTFIHGTLRKDTELLTSEFSSEITSNTRVSNSVHIIVPEGQEEQWAEQLRKKLGVKFVFTERGAVPF